MTDHRDSDVLGRYTAPAAPVMGEEMTLAESMMRQALDLFVQDPPDSLFQEGYLCALMIFANEGLGFAWDDPALARCEPLLKSMNDGPATIYFRKRFEVIDGDKS